MRWSTLVLALAVGPLAASAFGQERTGSSNWPSVPTPGSANGPTRPKPARPNDGGTLDELFLRIPASDFTPLFSTFGYLTGGPSDGGILNRFTTSPGSLVAGIKLPGGALLTYLELDYCDTAVVPMYTNLYDCDNVGQNCSLLLSTNLLSGGDGCSYASTDLTGLNYTVNNYARILTGVVWTPSGDHTNQLASLIIGYKLQVSPAPVTPSFGDVPTGDPGYQYIEALVSSGITAGCGGGNYCPDNPLTRRQMAIFLAKALGLHWHNH